MPGHLVTLNSYDEDYWCWSQFGNTEWGSIIGAFQSPEGAEPGGGWTWVTGEEWDYVGWGVNEPNNDHGGEDCLGGWFLNFTGWNDYMCDSLHPGGYIVEYELDSVVNDVRSWGAIKAIYR